MNVGRISVTVAVVIAIVACGGMEVSMAPDVNAQEQPEASASTESSSPMQTGEAPEMSASTKPSSPDPGGSCACVGERGPMGLQGVAGEPGKRGEQGPAGKDGVPGAQGAVGPVGPQGARGQKGEPGIPGSDGADGSEGPEGERGPAGAKGEKGDTGTVTTQSVYTYKEQWNYNVGVNEGLDKELVLYCDGGDILLSGGCSLSNHMATLFKNTPVQEPSVIETGGTAWGWSCGGLDGWAPEGVQSLSAMIVCLDVDGNHEG